MGTEFKFGKMVPSMKGIGDSIKLAGMENSGMLMATFLKANGLTIKPTDTVSTFIKTALDTRENGKTICSMEKVKKSGLILQCMKDSIMKEKNMDTVYIFGKTAPGTMVIGMKIKSKELANTSGKMEDAIMVNGKTIICMEKESTPGLMADDMKVNTKWIRSMGTEFTNGLTTACTKATGSMESSMVKANICYKMELPKLENGSMEKELIGLMKQTMLVAQIMKTHPQVDHDLKSD